MPDPYNLPRNPKFKDMYNIVHIDEKWFDLTRKKETYYVMKDVKEPHWPLHMYKWNFIAKIMFLLVMARPWFDDEGHMKFSGKIGRFSFITQKHAKGVVLIGLQEHSRQNNDFC